MSQKMQKAVLSVTFVPDRFDYVVVTAFAIPGRQAYQTTLEGVNEAVNETAKERKYSLKDTQEFLKEEVLSRIEVLKRDPNCDYDEEPIAPIRMMFSKGFEETDRNSYFYAGMGHFGYFLGEVECEIDDQKMTINNAL